MYEYDEINMAKVVAYENAVEEARKIDSRRYVDLNKSVFKLQYDEGFMALAYSTARIW